MAVSNGEITVSFVDLIRMTRGTRQDSFVIVADGSDSTMRKTLAWQVVQSYAGYLAWCGTVKETEVSEEAQRCLNSDVCVYILSKDLGYMLA